MNMDVKSVGKSREGLATKRLGTKAYLPIKALPPFSSTKKHRTFRTIKANVTSGTVRREESSSPIGSMRFISLFLRSFRSRGTGDQFSRPKDRLISADETARESP